MLTTNGQAMGWVIHILLVGYVEGFGRMNKFGLDATDIRILSAVQQYGQLSKTKLAEIANLSPTPCWARLDRLKAAGFISGYHADIALDKIADFTRVTVTVSLTHHRKSDVERFEKFIKDQDEIIECTATGGGMDYILTAVCKNLPAFRDLMDAMLAEEIGIERYVTYIATRVIKSARPNLSKLAAKPAK